MAELDDLLLGEAPGLEASEIPELPAVPEDGSDPPVTPPLETPPDQPVVLNHEDLPSDLRGKTPSEVNQIWKELIAAGQALTAQNQSLQTTAPAAAAPELPQISSEDLLDGGDIMGKLDQFFAAKLGPVQTRMESIAAEQTATAAQQSYPFIKQFPAQAQQYISRMNPEQKSNPMVWAALDGQLMKDNIQDLMKQANAASEKPPVPDTVRPVAAAPGVSSGRRMSAAEKLIADRLGISYDDYIKNRV